MRADAGKFVTELLDRIKRRYHVKTDEQVLDLLPKKDGKPFIHLTTLRKWKAGMQPPELNRLQRLLRLADPNLSIADCLYFPDQVSELRAFEIAYRQYQQAGSKAVAEAGAPNPATRPAANRGRGPK